MFLYNKLCVSLTDVLLPVAGDLAVDLVGPVLAGRLSQTVSTVSVFRDTFSVLRLSGGAVGRRPGLLMFPTWWSKESHDQYLQY